MEHTPEPWYNEWGSDGSLRIVESDETKAIIAEVNSAPFKGTGRTLDTVKANGKRLVACVNACAGIVDPNAELAKLRQDKANLVKAAKEFIVYDASVACTTGSSESEQERYNHLKLMALARLEVAIAKATQ